MLLRLRAVPLRSSFRGWSTSRSMASSSALASSASPSAAPLIHQSLDKITALLTRLNNPQNTFPVIHVAGTNAKGSTIAYLDSIARLAIGLRTGTFTSPHLIEERDCCRINGQVVDRAVWQEAGERVARADQEAHTGANGADFPQGVIGASPFESLVARALLSFNLAPIESRPELILVEVGMGGLLDATNVFPAKQVLASVICPIDKDHQAMLGDSLGEIAKHKAGIIKQGGLCVMADQRRGQEASSSKEPDATSVKLAQEELAASYGSQPGVQGAEASAEIVDTIRQTCIDLQARLVRAQAPLSRLSAASTSSFSASAASLPWSIQLRSSTRYSPTLSASRLKPGTFVARTGDPVVPGPGIVHPATRAALTGAHTALQTLWSVARDEPPSALELAGSDVNEELRLQIAWALRDDRDAQTAVAYAVAATRWPGRCEWVDVDLKEETASTALNSGGETQMESEPATDTDADLEKDDMQVDAEAAVSPTLHLLVDGAHNAASAAALRAYVDACIEKRISPFASSSSGQGQTRVNVTWLLAFSRGKKVEEMLSVLLSPSSRNTASAADATLAKEMQQVNLSGNTQQRQDVLIQHRVACLEFSTPVEGMPWVSSLTAEEVRDALNHVEGLGDMGDESRVKIFGKDLQGALRWAREVGGDGKSVSKASSEEHEASLCVLAGSLYLVGDLHRLLLSSSKG